MSSATAEARANKKRERRLEKQREAAQHDLPRSMRPSPAVKTLTVIVLVLALIYFLFPIYWAIIASTKTPSQMTSGNGMWFSVSLDQIPNAVATNYSKLLGWTRGNFWRWVLNSLIYSGVSAFIGAIVSVMAVDACRPAHHPPVLDLPRSEADQHDGVHHHPVLCLAVRLLPGPYVRPELCA